MEEILRILKETIEIFVEDLKPDEIRLDELDSIDLMELSMTIEVNFSVNMTGSEIAQTGSIAELGNTIAKKIKD